MTLAASEVLRSEAVRLVRGPLLAAALVQALAGTWAAVAAAWPHGDRWLFVAATMAVHAALYAIVNGFFFVCDSTGLLARYKLPRTRGQLPSAELQRRTVLDAVKGQALAAPAVLWYAAYPLARRMGMPAPDDPVPALGEAYVQLVVCLAVNEAGFYWAHRMLHLPAFYSRIHKQHHAYAGSIGIAAEYAHPVEQILANQLPTFGAVLLGGFHPLVWLVWLAWRLVETYEAHSGFCFRGTPLARAGLLHAEHAEHHDWHHTSNTGNYGSLFWDWLGGTMTTFEEHKRAQAATRAKRSE